MISVSNFIRLTPPNMALRYDKKLSPFPSRFNEQQREKIKAVSDKKQISEAEAVRLMVDVYELR